MRRCEQNRIETSVGVEVFPAGRGLGAIGTMRAVALVIENDQGFVNVFYYPTIDALDEMWNDIVHAYAKEDGE